MRGNEDDKEPDDKRIYVDGKVDELRKKHMQKGDSVWKSQYRWDRIKDKPISKLQCDFIKNGIFWPESDKGNAAKCILPFGLLLVPAVHIPYKLIQKVTSSVGSVIDKQQNISAIKASRS